MNDCGEFHRLLIELMMLTFDADEAVDHVTSDDPLHPSHREFKIIDVMDDRNSVTLAFQIDQQFLDLDADHSFNCLPRLGKIFPPLNRSANIGQNSFDLGQMFLVLGPNGKLAVDIAAETHDQADDIILTDEPSRRNWNQIAKAVRVRAISAMPMSSVKKCGASSTRPPMRWSATLPA